MGVGAIRACPNFVPDVTSGPLAFEASAGGYGYNSNYIGSSSDIPWIQTGMMNPTTWEQFVGNVPAKMNMILHGSSKIAFADAAMGQSGNQLIEYSFVEPPTLFWYVDPILGPVYGASSPSIHFRHRNRANIAWADGHVTSELFSWTYPGVNVYGANNLLLNLGYFGPHDNTLFQRN
jgi:prepilin-type processing-associated H-X9-DG protein